MIFRQLYEPESSTYTYLFADQQTRQAVLLDPVVETVERDLAVLQELELTLAGTLGPPPGAATPHPSGAI